MSKKRKGREYLFISTIVVILTFMLIFAVKMRYKDAISGITADSKIDYLNLTRPEFSANLGVYDPSGAFDSSKKIAIEHIYLNWNSLNKNFLLEKLNQLKGKNEWAMITIEPYKKSASSKNNLLRDVIAGNYDNEMNGICNTLKEFDGPIFIRWGHEMEAPSTRYPWANDNPDNYVLAYRRMIDLCKKTYNKGFYVWSPAGNNNSNIYFPGNDYADYIGLSIYAYPEWEKDNYGHIRSFDEIFKEKYERIASHNKPVMIAEFGVTGNENFKKEWVIDAFAKFNNYPLLKSVIYFNSKDSPGVWGEKYGTPDWTISPELFKK